MTASYELRFDSGRLCLDLVATVGARSSSQPVERLDNSERLAEWLTRSGLIPADQRQTATPEWLSRFIDLRALLHRLVHAVVDGLSPSLDDLERLNGYAAATPPCLRIRRAAGCRLQAVLSEPIRVEALLSVVARDAIDLLTSDTVNQLRECAGGTCDMVYLDTSRGRRRRWCSSTVCGNRARVSRHREVANITQKGTSSY